ncbi:hypothetical protein N473_03995 [Pseudoalteromonas luteoviolacea CPMOR-1]|uniref:Filamentous haemagglutinin FhaB/tRNA nuclease CdiA-like TPS domain-containing protein n=1 Tax=Pseudoalteromonas luteoviolacea CPMOR-1 TaxID=1365248 RepID=A0A167IGH7_9GAMM|nr:hypothetical protein [Pseudoalteromonas luteoviolacea]KZN59332.1 hypothetical protein N473_03995 [Pseudoalteromonas luteoviolacea CPMOR-1]
MKLIKIALLILLLGPNFLVSASTLTTTDSNISFLSGDKDKLIIAPPNQHGISYNRFTNFTVDKPLLMLDPNGLASSDAGTKLKTIVIHANSLSLKSELAFASGDIDANIVFVVNNDNGLISCSSCSFKGYPRITLAVADSSSGYSKNMSSIGNLTNRNAGRISLNNLSAPDATSIETHSQYISTAGNISSTFRASASGSHHKISNSGLVGVSGGFNFFLGRMTVDYNTHEIVDADQVTTLGAITFSGTIHGAGVSIVSARPVTINSGAKITTQSDIMATSHFGDDFFVPTGNIDIVMLSQTTALGTINNKGSVLSDTGINIQAIRLYNSGTIKGHNAEVTIKDQAQNLGTIEMSGKFELSAKTIDNRKVLAGNTLRAHATDAVFNHFGGSIVGYNVSFETDYFINGSRIASVPTIKKHSALTIEDGLEPAEKYGVFNTNSFARFTSAQLSANRPAHISATHLNIKANVLENINPYYKERGSAAWPGKVNLDYAKSRQVSITAQYTLKLHSSTYVLNSSAILGLENVGEFTINTPKLQNERYRFDSKGYVFHKKQHNSANEQHSVKSPLAVTASAHVDAISPMAALYSFGEFNHSPLNSSASTTFTNLASFLQIHGRSNFYKTTFGSIAISASSEYQEGLTPACITNACNIDSYEENYTQTTFTSFLDDVNGLSTDFLVQTNLQLEASIEQDVKWYQDKFIAEKKAAFGDEYHPTHGKMFHYNVREQKTTSARHLIITIYECRLSILQDGETFGNKRCVPTEYSKPFSEILEEAAANRPIPGTSHTAKQLGELIKIYMGRFNGFGQMYQTYTDSEGFPDTRMVDGYWGNVYANAFFTPKLNSSGAVELEVKYFRHFFKTTALQSPHVNLQNYNPYKEYTKVIAYNDLKDPTPPIPANRTVAYNNKTGRLVLNWGNVLVPHHSYILETDLSSAAIRTTQSWRAYTKKTDGKVKFRVKACTKYQNREYCSAFSPWKEQTVDYVGGGSSGGGSGGGGGGGDDDKPPCEGCALE